MKKINKTIFLVILMILLAGCNFPLLNGNNDQDQAEDEIDIVATQVAQTLQAIQQQEPTAQPTLPTQAPPAATALPQPTAVTSDLPASQPNCLIAGLVSETIPDNKHFAPGDTFTKTWKIINSGTCEWSANYMMVFESGEQMGGASPTYLNINVPAGNFTDVSISLKAPTTPGTYQGNWALQTESGTKIADFSVLIIVDDIDFAITTASLSADSSSVTASCPYTYNYTAKITANMLGTATYYFKYEDNSKSTASSVDFDSSGTESVTGSRELSASGTYTTKLYIDEPNHQFFDTLSLTLTCN